MYFSRIRALGTRISLSRHNRYQQQFDRELSFTKAVSEYKDLNKLYAYMHHYYRHKCPNEIRAHREYFKLHARGLGEDAFHAMWWLLFKEFRPRRVLEIGVYRGQIVSLWALIAQKLGFEIEVHGISPFAPIGDSVSSYASGIDYERDVLTAFEYLKLKRPILLRALSSDDIAVKHIKSQQWDLIYIDGCHDYDVARSDYEISREQITAGGIVVLDDASLYTKYNPPGFAFAGHVGPSRVARDLADQEMITLGIVGHNNVFRCRKAVL